MNPTRTYTPEELRYLKMLSRQYPTVRAAGTEIINLQAIMNLPKGCEHFISDVHGEYEAFLHILNSCSGVVRERLDFLYQDTMPRAKLDQLASGNAEGGGADIIINSSDMSGGDGGLFEQAVEFAIADGQISTSTLQRRLKIGYARAGRLTDEMEERGIVAAKDGSKPRKCLITREEWEEMKKSTEGMA